MTHCRAKNILLFSLWLVIAFPLLQHKFSFIESGPLQGAVTSTPNPAFTWGKWWAGTYQQQQASHLNDSTGLRPDLVRLNNQLDFWLFKKLHAHSVVIGKDECLFEQEYVDEYYGLDYTGEQQMRKAVRQLRIVQDTLERMGKTFVFIYAPSKAYYFSDKLPDRPRYAAPGAPTNYATFKRLADEAGIRQIDFNAWFLSQKATSPHLLMSRLGIHWTTYGSLLAADSFIRYIDCERHIQLPQLHWTSIHRTDTPRNADDDLARGLNLIYPFRKEVFSYPDYSYIHDSSTTMPRILYIGDSFLWIWLYDQLMQSLSSQFDIWYYFRAAWNQNTITGREPERDINDFDWQQVLMTSDCITVLYVPSSFHSFPDKGSSIDKLYTFFYPKR